MGLQRKERPDEPVANSWTPSKSVRLYLDDVDRIFETMKGFGAVTVETAEFEGEIAAVDELKGIGVASVKDLIFSVRSEARSLVVNMGAPQVFISPSEDLELYGAAQRINDILASRRTVFGGVSLFSRARAARWNFLAERGIELIAAILTLVAATLGIWGAQLNNENDSLRDNPELANERDISDGQGDLSAWALIFMGSAIAVLALSFTLKRLLFGPNPRPRGVVILSHRSEMPPWWQANRSGILIGLLTSAVVSAVFLLIGLAIAA